MELLLILWLGLGFGFGDGGQTVAGYRPPSDIGRPQRTGGSGGRLFEAEMEEIG